ncbi:MAG: 30S ribosome-binding factor RbfA [Acidimicrobiia bacterium]|nr:30S ribosome-binding factor RbfA [Acidimicrobiia bacterium]MYC57282.1 30S ribosome-binding factor RbfA [Acidimicrobiia bacterium]MYG94486.1 30S ribosome-binding factor RbfA [Acidimicrobiia bacterium]MYI30928.1 30S ribosome-binding factor RbfA [Acidimicrobiia bacterium]
MARRPASRPSHYSRSARLGELLREIVASELAQLDDSRLELVSVTGVDTSAELSRATVYISVLDTEGSEDALQALQEHRLILKGAVAQSSAVRRVPDLVFALDPSIAAGERVDEILRSLADED